MLFALSHKGRRVRLAAIWIPTVVVIGAALLLFLRLICVPILVYFRPGLDVFIYDLAVYGVYPQRHYRSFHLASPSPRTLVWKAGVCQQESSDGGLVIMDLHGAGVSDSGPAVLDLKGNLVWTNDTFGGHAMNVKVQTYEGQEHLTFWAGDDEDHGNCYMLDSGFNLAYTISAVGDNLWDDPHQCKITEDGTALIIAFNFTEADLSSTHVAHLGSFIVDAVIQEIDIESGELVFEWRASDHVADNNEYLKSTFDAPFVRHSKKYHDYFHMNSVDKDSNGNLLVSIRHTHSIINIDTKTGQILWGFGGTSRDFEDLSGGLASNFHGQHDARWVDEGKGLLSLFDNVIAEHHWHDGPHSLGKVFHLDVANRTAELMHTYHTLRKAKSTSQGSFQYLPNHGSNDEDRVFIGWGSVPTYTLHDADTEELLCETHYGPSLFQYYEFTKSYRIFRAPPEWKARPEAWDPSAVVTGGRAYVSWNGGMEVRSWVLQRSENVMSRGESSADWADITTTKRDGFETAFELPAGGKNTVYRIAALDASETVIRYSNTFESTSGSWMLPMLPVVIGLAALVPILVGVRRRRQVLSWVTSRRSCGAYAQILSDEAPEGVGRADAPSP